MKIIMLFIFVLSSSLCLSSYDDLSLNVGKEFVVCYPQNYDTLNVEDDISLLLCVSSYKGRKSNFTLKYTIDNKEIVLSGIVEANDIRSLFIPIELEIKSYKHNEKKAIFIYSEDSVSVMAMSKQRATTDAFLCFPTDVLGTSYIVASHKSAFRSIIGDPLNMYSSIVIAAVEDNTTVEVIPSAPIEGFNTDVPTPFSFTMNKGETRQLVARITKKYDLTGSIVNSNKKVAVYSCHQDASITPPKTTDVLIEQTLPIPRLGSKTIFNPVMTFSDGTTTMGRIIAPFDNTLVSLEDTSFVLNRSNYYEYYFDSANVVSTTKPVLFAEYCLSARDDHVCDPFLVLLPPVESYLNEYFFRSPSYSSIKKHLVSVVIHKDALNTMILDNSNLVIDDYSSIKGSDFVHFSIKIPGGNHKISADSSFGIISYGFGDYESYGYIPGMRTHRQIDRIMDKEPPEIQFAGDCNTRNMTVKESGDYMTGLGNIDILENENIHINYDYEEKMESAATLSLVDELQDGYIIVNVYDINGNKRQDTLNISGFTLLPEYDGNDSVFSGKVLCNSFPVKNHGKFTQEYECFLAENINISVPPSHLIQQIESNDMFNLPYCISSSGVGSVYDTLYLIDNCERIISIPLSAVIKPNVFTGQSRCDVDIRLETVGKTNVQYSSNKLVLNNFSGKIQVYSLIGQLVYDKSFHKNSDEVDFNLIRGMYIIVVMDEKGNVSSKKIIITN